MAATDAFRVAVVGATGMVGGILLEQFERRRFPVGTLLPFSSGRSPRAAVHFRGRRIAAPAVSERALLSCDLAFLVSSDEVARRYGPVLARNGIWVIDDSSAFRLHENVPLVIPEVNASALAPNKRLIAGPNCTVTGAAVAGLPIHRHAEALHVRIASYQAVSGAGKDALREFYAQARRGARSLGRTGTFPRLPREKASALPQPIAFSVFPQVGAFDGNGDCGEEIKIRNELRKLWGVPELRVSATTVRVPVIRGHSLALWIETARPLRPEQARRMLARTPGIQLWNNGAYPTPALSAGSNPVHVGRLRSSGAGENELSLWVVSDNLLKGAALNSLQIAEFLIKKGWLRRRSP